MRRQKQNELELKKLTVRVKELGYTVKVMKSIKDFLADAGYDEEYGARPLNRAIQKFIEDPISEEILKGNVKEGQIIAVSYSKVKEKVEIKLLSSGLFIFIDVGDIIFSEPSLFFKYDNNC